MKQVAICSYARTGIGKATRGKLNNTHGIAMLSHAITHALARTNIGAHEVGDVVVGCGLPEGATGHNIARNALLAAGLGDGVPGATINRYCASGITAIQIAAQQIAQGDCQFAIAGGVESLSLTQPSLNIKHFVYEPLQKSLPGVWWSMIQTAEFVAEKYKISRSDQDEYALLSQKRVAAAIAANKFQDEIVPFSAVQILRDGSTGEESKVSVVLDRDEGPRADTTIEGLAKLKPVAGTHITAGNASQLSDGAAALVLADADEAVRRGLPILALYGGVQMAAVDAREMSTAIAPALRKLLAHHSLSKADIDLWELHEAFAVTTLYNQRELDTPWETTNVNGGAIALGHPFGMSGIRYAGTLALELARRKAKHGAIGVCTSGGMGAALLIERP